MRGGLRARMFGASIALALIVAAAFLVLLLSVRDLRNASELSRQSEEAIATANEIERLLIDIQSGARGFVITGDERFLEHWREARATFADRAAALARLVDRSPGQRERARDLAEAGDSYIEGYSRPLVEVARDDLARAREVVADIAGERRVDALRAQFEEFVAAEDVLRNARRANAEEAAGRAIFFGVAGLLGSLLLVLVFAAYLGHGVVEPLRRISSAADRLAEGDLSARADEGGAGEVADLGRAFNAMVASLQESRAELESQNLELELQASELGQQREALELERRRLEAVLEQMVGGVVIAEAPHGRIVLASRQAREIVGQDIQAASVEEYARHGGLHPRGRPDEAAEPALARALQRGQTIVGEAMDFVRPDGTSVALEVNAAPIRDAQGEIVAAVATFFDVTERRRAEEEIRALNDALESRNRELESARAAAEESDQLVRSIVRGATDLAITAVDSDGVIIMFSEGAERMLGYRAEELLGQSSVVFHDEAEVEARAAELGVAPGFEVFVRSAREGIPETRDWTYIRKDGRRLTVSLTVMPRRGAGGELVGFAGIAVDVTQARRAEESIRALNEELGAQRLELDRFFSLSLELLAIAGVDGFFKRINPAFEAVLGYTLEELQAQPFLEFVHPEDRAATLAEVEKLAAGVDTIAFENRYRCKDGSYRWLLWSARATADRGLIYAAARDVTDRKEAEERITSLNQELESQNLELELSAAELEARQVELEEANTELEAQQSELERALDELGAEKRRVETLYQFVDRLSSELELEPFARRAFSEVGDLVGTDVGTLYFLRDETAGTYSLAAAHGVDPAKLPPEVLPGVGLAGRALAEQRPVAMSHGASGLTLQALGEDIPVRHELHLPLVVAGRTIGVLALARVSDRPFSDDEVTTIDHLAGQLAVMLAHRLALDEARRVASINRAVLDATVDGIRLVDAEGRTLLANEEVERITTDVLGLPSDSTLAERSEAIVGRIVDPTSFLAAQEAIAADPDAETLDEFEVADSHRWFRRYTAPVRNTAGELIGRIIVLRETTSERASERLKSELVATVSHELRTPLTGIMGFAELLARHDLDEDTRRSYVGTILAEAQRLTALVNDFLDLQRIESAEFALSVEPFDLGELLSREIELYSMQGNGHLLELLLGDEPIVVEADRDRVAQVVGNLLSNAIKYSPDGGPVRVAASAGPRSVRVSVQDAGLGIPLEQQAGLFTKFFRVDSSDTRSIGGTGLGLALAKELVEAHGGTVGFQSLEGKGSTFWFELPLDGNGNGAGR